ncbi:Glyoxalase-like domain protein [Actinomadura rubteroloni]|uniref:Glyoxalase-like domain protein n=1 Tax=Actinomadura rubteroloni TaxID=1926885 RepID=A0A2P4UCI4_9ACTN|nr:VOC family protein [Actinomadura rubteroloni]POM22756.1 Glyoxalase-like domain protein [Actinomadura rubteroloni]
MSATAYNSVAWFEIGTDRPAEVRKFFGELFDWTFAIGPEGEMSYQEITAPGADAPSGGIFPNGGASPDYAVFYVVVQDVAATVARAQELGGKVIVPRTEAGNGLVFAHLADSAGHHFGVFTPPAV